MAVVSQILEFTFDHGQFLKILHWLWSVWQTYCTATQVKTGGHFGVLAWGGLLELEELGRRLQAVSPMLGNRMCSREVVECPGGERPLIYIHWARLRPGSRHSNLLMGPIGRTGDVKKTITPKVTMRHSLPLSFSRLYWFLCLSFSQYPCLELLTLFYPLCPPPNFQSTEL